MAKKPHPKAKPGFRRIARDSITGRIVSLAYAKEHPESTTVEQRRIVPKVLRLAKDR